MIENENIFKNIEDICSLTHEEKCFFLKLLSEEQYYKGQILVHEGSICSKIYFIKKGCLMSYLLSPKGSEHILTIGVKNWWITDMNSFVYNERSTLYIKAVENSDVFVLTRKNLEILTKKYPCFEYYFRFLMERALASNQRRIVERMSLSADERFNIFVEKYPCVVRHLNYKQIASYIDVTPAFLSRMLKGKDINISEL